MKLLCLLAGALLAAAIVEANINDFEHDYEIVHRHEPYNDRLNFNDKNWHNQARNLKYKFATDGEYDEQRDQRFYEPNHHYRHFERSGLDSDDTFGSTFSEVSSENDYTFTQSEDTKHDVAYNVGSASAKKIIKFYALLAKYFNKNGEVQNIWSDKRVESQQIALYGPNHDYLILNEDKFNGFDQGILKYIKFDSQNDNVDVDYYFNKLSVNGFLNTNNGKKEVFQVQMLNTNVTVATELYNKNLKSVDVYNEKLDITFENQHMLNEHIKMLYLRHLKQVIENETVENAHFGLMACMRSEAKSGVFFPVEDMKNMEIYNKRTGLKVTLVEIKNWRETHFNNGNKISSVTVKPIRSSNGSLVKVNIVMSKLPTWESVIQVQKGNQQNTFSNVKFQANEIAVTATMASIRSSERRPFEIFNVDFRFNGLRFDVPNDQTLATELQQNLKNMFESKMAFVLRKQLQQEYQVYQQDPEQYSQCTRSARSLIFEF